MNIVEADTVHKLTFHNENIRAPFYLITVDSGVVYFKATYKDHIPHVNAVRDYDLVITKETPLKTLKSNFLNAGSWFVSGADGITARYAVMEVF
jgi:hypothetical protein